MESQFSSTTIYLNNNTILQPKKSNCLLLWVKKDIHKNNQYI